MKVLSKIDRFYYFLSLLLIVLAVVVIISVRGIFEAARISGEVEEDLLSSTVPHVDRVLLDEALNKVNNRNIVPLDLKE